MELEVKNLKFKYKKSNKYVLEDVSFSLKKDKLNAIVGVNGSGKTTLFDCITKVLKPQSGIVNLPDINEILYLTQSIFFSPLIKGKDLAKFIFDLSEIKNGYSIEYFYNDLTDSEIKLLNHLWDLKLGKMSYGERKWLFLTLLSIVDRSLYIFDEPMSGVDPSSRRKISSKIKKMISQQKICIISTHQLQDLSHIDCHLILLHEGTILYEGDYKQWLENYNSNDPDEVFELMTTGIHP